jgi:hypothetical protein
VAARSPPDSNIYETQEHKVSVADFKKILRHRAAKTFAPQSLKLQPKYNARRREGVKCQTLYPSPTRAQFGGLWGLAGAANAQIVAKARCSKII